MEWLEIGLGAAALLAAAAFAAFLVASTFGIGGPLILLPVLMSVFEPAQAVALVAPVMLCNNIGRMWLYRRDIQLAPALIAGLGALPAALFASLFTGLVPGRALTVAIAGFIVIAVLVPRLARRQLRVGRRGLVGWGTAIGLVAGLSGTAGPPMAVAMKGYGLLGVSFVATVAVLQFGLQLVRIPTYLSTGVFPIELLPLAAIMSVAAAASVFAARPILRRLEPARFRRLLDGLLLVIAIYLVFRAAMA